MRISRHHIATGIIITLLAVMILPATALAQDAAGMAEPMADILVTTAMDTPMDAIKTAGVPDESVFIFNTLSFLFSGVLVMWMAAGFAMLEAGLVRSKNTATICLKNIALYSLAGIMFYLIGYQLMYSGVAENTGWIGTLDLFYNAGAEELALINADEPTDALTVAAISANDYGSMSDWFFQMVFVATAGSIVSGTLAERIRLWPFLIFVLVLTGIIYPIQGAWTWGGGWLNGVGEGFSDFAGSTIVHSVGGWAALTGAIILGPRLGKYNADGSVNALPGANLPLATLGTFVLWMGWFGFNGGSQLAAGSALDISAMSIVYVNTNMAAAAGVVVAMVMAQLMYKKVDLTFALNGALAGLVSITAGPDIQHHGFALIIGGVGGALVVLAVPFFDKLKIDDVVGAISVHLVAGIWGTLAVGIFGGGDLMAQIIGIAAIGGFVIVSSVAFWLILKYTIGIRADQEEEMNGLDKSELGLEAYPEFR